MNIKKSYFLPLCLSAVILCGCSQTEKTETTAAAETTASVETTARTTATTTVQTTSETTVPTTSPKKELTQEQKQIQTLLSEAKRFFNDYVRGYELQTHADYGKVITREVVFSDGSIREVRLFEIVDGDVITKTDLINKMKPYFTDEYIDEMINFLGGSGSYYYFDENGIIHISDSVGSQGSRLGYSTAYVSSVDEIDEETLVLNMTAFGSAERWGYDKDITDYFAVTLKRTEDGLKIDKCDKRACFFITDHYKPEDDIFE